MYLKIKKSFHFQYLLLFFISSCSLKEVKLQSPLVNDLEPNKKYRINLPEEHSSGYIWRLDENYDHSVINNFSSVWHGNRKGVDYNFNTLAPGQTTLNFHLIKYRDTADSKHFIVKITRK